MIHARITGTGSYLPGAPVGNQALIDKHRLESSDAWIIERTGIRSRHLAAPDVTSSELALHACRRALAAAGRQVDEVDLLIVATSTPDFIFPSTAALLQNKLGMNHGAAAFPLVQRLKPRFVVDFGCGRNDFIGALRRFGIDGLGIDFAFPEADIPRAMHQTGLLDGVADVVTSFDALEHLLPEDVDAVLAEMRRVAKPSGHFVFSICTRPSRS